MPGTSPAVQDTIAATSVVVDAINDAGANNVVGNVQPMLFSTPFYATFITPAIIKLYSPAVNESATAQGAALLMLQLLPIPLLLLLLLLLLLPPLAFIYPAIL